jgi:hypothetical protein
MEQVIVEVAEVDTHSEEAAVQELSQSQLALVGGGSGIMLFI